MTADAGSLETIIERLRLHATRQPEKIAYTFIKSDGALCVVTFSELAKQAFSIASSLRERCSKGDRIMLVFAPGLDFIVGFLGCLAGGLVAVPAYPPRRNQSIRRLQAIVRDASPKAFLTGGDKSDAIGRLLRCEWPEIQVLDVDRLSYQGNLVPDNSTPAIDSVALLQYTSGSTAEPRGVVVTHGNLAFNEYQIQAGFEQTADSIMVSWLPLFHDMGLIGGVLQPLFVGGSGVLMSPNCFLREPLRWLKAISDYRGTTTGAPNFAYDYCVTAISDSDKSGIDLSSLKIAYNGAEPVRATTIERFTSAFCNYGFRREAFFPCYGLAESTLFVSGGPPGRVPRKVIADTHAVEEHRIEPAAGQVEGSRQFVSSGRLAEGTKALIVDTATGEICSTGMVGEIWLRSASVAKGYWNNDLATYQVFRATIGGTDKYAYLRTGDLGFIEDGELFVTGRLKDIILIRGRNVYPQDIEAAVESVVPSAQANTVAAFGVTTDHDELVAAVVEGNRQILRELSGKRELPEIRTSFPRGTVAAVENCLATRIRHAVALACDVSLDIICIVRPGCFLRTTSGKVQRRACKRELIEGRLEVLHCWKSPKAEVLHLPAKDLA